MGSVYDGVEVREHYETRNTRDVTMNAWWDGDELRQVNVMVLLMLTISDGFDDNVNGQRFYSVLQRSHTRPDG